jgi:bacteriocin biosynthesis cyclodehydratase domain-containing protein
MTRPSQLRPVLVPGLARAWRNRRTLQIGLDPDRAVLVDLPEPRLAGLLDLLDGSRTERFVLDQVRRMGVEAADARTVLDLLVDAGVVMYSGALVPGDWTGADQTRLAAESAALALAPEVPDPPARVLRRRAGSRVVLAGQSRLAASVAVTLAQAGVGRLHVAITGRVTGEGLAGGPLTGDDVGRPAAEAVEDAVRRAAPGVEFGPPRRGPAALVVQFPTDEPADLVAERHRLRRQPYLCVALREGTPVVGPLVLPGSPPCLGCLELHRRDRDAAWELLSRQLPVGGAEPVAATTALAAAAYVAAECLAHLDGGRPQTRGSTVDLPAATRVRRRTWSAHPGCGCGSRRLRTRCEHGVQ